MWEGPDEGRPHEMLTRVYNLVHCQLRSCFMPFADSRIWWKGISWLLLWLGVVPRLVWRVPFWMGRIAGTLRRETTGVLVVCWPAAWVERGWDDAWDVMSVVCNYSSSPI